MHPVYGLYNVVQIDCSDCSKNERQSQEQITKQKSY